MPSPLYNIMGTPPVQPVQGFGMPPQIQQVIARARQIGQMMQDPASLVSQFFPYIPQNIANDPNQILNYMLQNGKITREQLNQAIELKKYAGF